jgi:succinate dehydrogenase hydrophobic membrane anchor protein
MILLFLWIFYSFQSLSNNFEESFYSWIKTPFNLFLFIILIIFTVHHSLLGMLNIFEDYIHSKKIKKISSVFLKLISFILISISIVSVYQIAQ